MLILKVSCLPRSINFLKDNGINLSNKLQEPNRKVFKQLKPLNENVRDRAARGLLSKGVQRLTVKKKKKECEKNDSRLRDA